MLQSNSLIFELYYHNIVYEDLVLKKSVFNIHEVPAFSALTISHSSGLITKNPSYLIPALSGLQLITGQKPKITKAKKSVAGFQTRTKQPIGCKVTLRGSSLFAFFENLVITTLPRCSLTKLETSKKLKSHFHFGMEQMLFFPELESHYDLFELFRGCHVHISTTASSQESCELLLTAFKFPVTKERKGAF